MQPLPTGYESVVLNQRHQCPFFTILADSANRGQSFARTADPLNLLDPILVNFALHALAPCLAVALRRVVFHSNARKGSATLGYVNNLGKGPIS